MSPLTCTCAQFHESARSGSADDLADIDHRQRIGRDRKEREFVGLEHDQRKPRPQAIVLRRGGREEPGEVGRVEFDAAEIVRLEVDGEVARLGADDVPRIDADDVAGPEHLDRQRRGSTVLRRAALCTATESCTLRLARLGSAPPSGLLTLAPMPRRAQLRK